VLSGRGEEVVVSDIGRILPANGTVTIGRLVYRLGSLAEDDFGGGFTEQGHPTGLVAVGDQVEGEAVDARCGMMMFDAYSSFSIRSANVPNSIPKASCSS
jgi:hypothetical protein